MNDTHPMVGHVHLKVSDLERSVKFYTEALGFELTTRMGDSAAFLSFGGYHHHLGLNTWQSKGGPPPPRNAPGLFHFALLFPDRRSLARTVKRALQAGVTLDGASDHGVSEAVYLHDPDHNGIELYRDRPREEWPHGADGKLAMYTAALDLDALLAEAG
jgi:catechol 2,3-dioxygenase